MEEIKKIIENSNSFALVAKEEMEEYEFLSREALRNFLTNKKKTVHLIPENQSDFTDKWSAILSELKTPDLFESISIHIPKGKTKIKEINYEDTDEAIDLNIITENGALNPGEIILEPRTAGVDAVFCFNIPNQQSAENLLKLKTKIPFPGRNKIILINPGEETLAKKALAIMQTANNELIDNETATLLFASLIAERMCSHQQLKEKTMEIEKELLRFGADKSKIKDIVAKSLSLDQLPIF